MANWATVAALGDPSTEQWKQQNLTWVEAPNGERWQVYAPAAQSFQGLLGDLVARGYVPRSSGGYNYRNIRGGDQLSQHAFGTAIDLNAMTNQLGQSATDIPDAAALAEKWGLEWGGNWKGRPDPMHFEYRGGGAPTAVADSGIAGTMADAVDPRAATMAAISDNPWKSITDTAPRRGGLVGEGSAGGGLSTVPEADPGIPPLETASARLTPDALAAQAPANAPSVQLGQLGQLFRVKPFGGAAGQALPAMAAGGRRV